jgi:hypothetical protein
VLIAPERVQERVMASAKPVNLQKMKRRKPNKNKGILQTRRGGRAVYCTGLEMHVFTNEFIGFSGFLTELPFAKTLENMP